MSVLICKNITSEGPGTIEEYLREQGIAYEVVDLYRGEPISDPEKFDTLVMLGGPMSVNDDDKYPYIKDEEVLTRDFIRRGKRVFGVCLGAQVMAKALGARVYKGPAPEIGWLDVTLSEDGLRDPLLLKLAAHPSAGEVWKRFKVFQWHGETFDIPEGAAKVFSSDMYPNQAFRVGQRAYAFQFHIEVTGEIIMEWMSGEKVDISKVKADTERYFDDYRKRAFAFYAAFFGRQNSSHRR